MMKKILLLAAAIVCAASMALAEGYTPSITAEGMYGAEIEFVDTSVTDAQKEGVYLLPVTQTLAFLTTGESVGLEQIDLNNVETAYRELYQMRNEVLETIVASESVAAFFGDSVDFEAELGTSEYHLDELIPVIAGGFTDAHGDVKARVLFSTPYDKDEKVIVMIGIVTGMNADGTRIITWIPYEGIGIGEVEGAPELSGAVEITLDNSILLQIQSNEALLAVVSA